jgi:hypothetical protein
MAKLFKGRPHLSFHSEVMALRADLRAAKLRYIQPRGAAAAAMRHKDSLDFQDVASEDKMKYATEAGYFIQSQI